MKTPIILIFLLSLLPSALSLTLTSACSLCAPGYYCRNFTTANPTNTAPFNGTYTFDNTTVPCNTNDIYTITTDCNSACQGCRVTINYTTGVRQSFCSESAKGKQFLLLMDSYHYRSYRMTSRKTNYDWCGCNPFYKSGYTGNLVDMNCSRCGNFKTCSSLNGGPFSNNTVQDNQTFCHLQEIEQYYRSTHFICASQCSECLIVAVSKTGQQYGACYERALGDQFWKPLNRSYARIDPTGARTFKWCGCNQTAVSVEEGGTRQGVAAVVVLSIFMFLFIVGIVILCCVLRRIDERDKEDRFRQIEGAPKSTQRLGERGG